jgi:hypothetical protein
MKPEAPMETWRSRSATDIVKLFCLALVLISMIGATQAFGAGEWQEIAGSDAWASGVS